MGDWLAEHDDVLPVLAAVMTGVLVWRAYRYGHATGAYRALNGEMARLRSEAMGG